MRRIILSILALSLIVGTVFATGTKEAAGGKDYAKVIKWAPNKDRVVADTYVLPQGAKEAIAAEGTKKLVIYNWGDLAFDPATVASGKAFTELTGVEIEWVGTPDEQMMPKLQPLFVAQSDAVDIVPLDGTNYRAFVEKNWLMPVDFLWDEATLNEYQSGLRNVSVNGHHFSTPQVARVTDIMYYRPSMLKAAGYDKPPATLDEFLAMIKKMTIDKDGNGSIDQWGYAFRASGVLDGAEIVKAISLLYGVNPDNVNGKVKYNGPETVKAADFLVKLRNEYKVVPPGVTAYQHGDVADFFLSGNVAIVIDPTYLYARCLESPIKDDFAIALQPRAREGGPSTVIQNWNGWAVSNYSKNKAAALLFLDMYRSYQAQVREFVLENNEVLLKKAYTNPDALKVGYAKLLSQVSDTVISVYLGQGDVYKAVIAEFQNALIGRKTAQQAMDDAQKQIDTIMGY
ncbi:MAG: sugar ABC transporter substrate-binding protein [Spirochaetes bacterium]|nr:sugar ABC transporter substrate-binding protein [Spirochaetota bacterium]